MGTGSSVGLRSLASHPLEETKLMDTTYGPHTVYRTKDPNITPPVLMGARYQLDSVMDQGMMGTLLDQRFQMNGPDTLQLMEHYAVSPGVRGAYWEYPMTTLEREIIERRSSSIPFIQLTRFFNEPECWAFIYKLVKRSIDYCKKLSRYHGDIQPKMVIIRHDGDLILNDILNYIPHKEDGYSRVLRSVLFTPQGKTASYTAPYFALLSPQACEDINRKNVAPTYDKNKNEVFSIALTVLAAIGNVPPGDAGLKMFYNITAGGKSMQVNYDSINKVLTEARMQQQRSQLLVDTLRIMLAPNEIDRPSLFQVLEFLKMASA